MGAAMKEPDALQYFCKLFVPIIISLSMISCYSAEFKSQQKLSGIYGKLWVINDNYDDIEYLLIEENNKKIIPDKNGIYYSLNLTPGTYNIVVKSKSLGEFRLTNISCTPGEITILYNYQLSKFADRSQDCGTYKVKMTDPLSFGSINGRCYVFGRDTLINAKVHVSSTFWSTFTDSSGFYKIDNILAGKYELFARATYEFFARATSIYTIEPIEVFPDSIVKKDLYLKVFNPDDPVHIRVPNSPTK